MAKCLNWDPDRMMFPFIIEIVSQHEETPWFLSYNSQDAEHLWLLPISDQRQKAL